MNQDYRLVDQLVSHIMQTINEGKKSGRIRPEKTKYQKQVVHGFLYTPQGFQRADASTKEFTRNDWSGAEYALRETIKQSTEYSSLSAMLKPLVQDKDRTILDKFLRRVISTLLEDQTACLDKLKELLINEVNGGLTRHVVSIGIVGLVPHSNRIKITESVLLRQTRKEDLEAEMNQDSGSSLFSAGLPRPSAFIEYESYSTGLGDIRRTEWLSLIILKLFKVIGIMPLYGKVSSDTLSPSNYSSYYNNPSFPSNTGAISKDEEEPLRRFWQCIEPHIPKSLTEPSSADPDHSYIAYHRYDDALSKPGPAEPRISSAIMGLESIFLRGDGELQELSYRLRLRVAKLVGILGHDAMEAAEMIKDAYSIRSKFVHGGLLSPKERKKLTTAYGHPNRLVEKILDFLRISIIVSITINVSKGELVSTIDRSFLDPESNDRLNRLVDPARGILRTAG